jgi:hypothetical protein
MYILLSQLLDLGVSQTEISTMLDRGEWKLYPVDTGNAEPVILISSLPQQLQAKWAIVSQLSPNNGQFTSGLWLK